MLISLYHNMVKDVQVLPSCSLAVISSLVSHAHIIWTRGIRKISQLGESLTQKMCSCLYAYYLMIIHILQNIKVRKVQWCSLDIAFLASSFFLLHTPLCFCLMITATVTIKVSEQSL